MALRVWIERNAKTRKTLSIQATLREYGRQLRRLEKVVGVGFLVPGEDAGQAGGAPYTLSATQELQSYGHDLRLAWELCISLPLE